MIFELYNDHRNIDQQINHIRGFYKLLYGVWFCGFNAIIIINKIVLTINFIRLFITSQSINTLI